MATFLEGVESITLACSLVVIVPGLLAVLLPSERRAPVAVAVLIGTATMMWARAGRLWEVESTGGRSLIIGASIAAISIGLVRVGADVSRVALGLGAGLIAGWLWQPCVGEHFGEALNRAETDRFASLLLMHAYVAGLFVPLALVAAVPLAAPRLDGALHHRRVRAGALVVSAIYAVTVAAGRYDDLVGELFRISST